ncbi:ATP-binding protein [Motilimonas sp. KMU-193]|uniref:ATP-binding protein n=1 Tax=Motilimonas sp. KMU-193 TaxID=3388668 RepID=UPI00396B0C87
MKIPFNSLFFKIFTGFWLLIFILVAILVALPMLDNRSVRPIDQFGIELLNKSSHHLVLRIGRHPERDLASTLRNFRPQNGFRFYALDQQGRFLNDRVPKAVRRFAIESESVTLPQMWQRHDGVVLGPIQLIYNGQPLLIYAHKFVDQQSGRLIIRWLLDNPGLLILIALIVSTPICLFLAWHLTSPLRQLQSASHKIAKGELETQIPQLSRRDEIGQLANSMDKMVLSLKTMLSSQQRLLSDISHELRSPLTRLRLALAISRKHQGESNELNRIDVEAERLEQMISDLLSLSRSQFQPQEMQTIRLDSLLEALLEDAQFEAEQTGKQFHYDPPPAIELQAYPALLSSAIENVIRNAIHYGQHEIKLTIAQTPQALTFVVQDDGPGIPEHELSEIFRPFYRVSQARDRETGGTGLGLAICDNAMHKHGGSVKAENVNPGLKVSLTLPL